MSFSLPGRGPGAAHHEHCVSSRCCRCQQRPWTTDAGGERLCGLCASCCRECGRAPAPHLDGLDNGLCGDCRGLCVRCGARLPADGDCPCPRRRPPGADPVGYVLRALPPSLAREFRGRFPSEIVGLVRHQLGRRTPDQLLDRVERRWNARWSHALRETDDAGHRRRRPLDIAEQLLRPGLCPEPACEDGRLLTADAPCPRCAIPLHRFVPGQADRRAGAERARTTAAAIRREMLDRRTGRPR
ncbi:hypothetical protein [Streptomyces sp. NPDC059783]|uniref:hypothetical protein n=1 Tax=Streptomyces sp. NPDC059783 TaxID=3346944 RepID=UPI00364F094E